MTQVFQTVTFNMSVDVTEVSRRAEMSVKFGYVTNGNFTKMDVMLQPAQSENLPLPSQLISILTNGTVINLTVTWGLTSHIFLINKYLHISDMTGVTGLSIANNYTPPVGSPSLAESVRILLL